MKVIRVFLLGVFYGWLLKLVIDRVYRNDEVAVLTDENALLRRQIRSLESQAQSRSVKTTTAPRAATQSSSASAKKSKDDLKTIKGLGPAAEKKLNAAGVNTFAKLAGPECGRITEHSWQRQRRSGDDQRSKETGTLKIFGPV